MRDEPAEGEAELRYPIRGTFVGCCASADTQSAKSMVQSVRTLIFLVMFFSALSTRHSTLDTRPFSLDHLVRPIQQRLRDRQADLLCRLEIDDELKLRRLLDGQVSGLGAFENPVHVVGGAPKIRRIIG